MEGLFWGQTRPNRLIPYNLLNRLPNCRIPKIFITHAYAWDALPSRFARCLVKLFMNLLENKATGWFSKKNCTRDDVISRMITIILHRRHTRCDVVSWARFIRDNGPRSSAWCSPLPTRSFTQALPQVTEYTMICDTIYALPKIQHYYVTIDLITINSLTGLVSGICAYIMLTLA